MSLSDIDSRPASREVGPCLQQEIPLQTSAQKFDFCHGKRLRVEITAATIATTTAVVHVPDGNTECRVKMGYDVLGNAFDTCVSIEQLEMLIEHFGRSGNEPVMDIRFQGARIKHFDAPGCRGKQFGKLPMFPLH